MITLVIAFNPNHIKPEDLVALNEKLKLLGIQFKSIPHYQNNADPIYLIAEVETK